MTPFDDILLPRRLRLAAATVEVLPLTLCHGWILESLESPYIAGGEFGVADFVVAACILSRPADVILRDGLGKVLEESKPLAAAMAQVYTADAAGFQKDNAALSDWIEQAFKGYRVKRDKEGGGGALPFCYALAALLRTEFHMAFDEAMRWPLKQAVLDIQTLAELRGGKNILSGATARLLDEMAAARKGGK